MRGKSTLVNALVGQKVAITSAKAQTTRTRVMGIAIEGETQLVLVDTPGVFAPSRRLDRAMVQAAWGGTQDADLIALIVDGRAGLGPKMEPILEGLAKRKEPKWLILNKVDIATKEKLLTLTTRIHERIDVAETYYVSAQTGDGLPELKAAMARLMPKAPGISPPTRSPTRPTGCSPPRLLASSSTTNCTRNCLIRAQSRRAI